MYKLEANNENLKIEKLAEEFKVHNLIIKINYDNTTKRYDAKFYNLNNEFIGEYSRYNYTRSQTLTKYTITSLVNEWAEKNSVDLYQILHH